MDPWTVIVRTARRQHGLFATPQASAAGTAPSTLHGWLRAGRVIRLHRGVYRIAGAPDSWEARVLAAQLAGGPHTVASHATAAHLLGLLDAVRPDRIELTAPRGRARDVPRITLHTTQHLPPHHVTTIGPIKATAVERTIVDTARLREHRGTRRTIHDAWRRGLTDPRRLRRCLSELGPVDGAAVVRDILSTADPRLAQAYSPAETEAFHHLQRAELRPLPEVNHPIVACGRSYLLDLAWPRWMFAYELDSDEFHTLVVDVAADRRKQADCEAQGWTIERIPARLPLHRPDAFVRRVRRDLARFV